MVLWSLAWTAVGLAIALALWLGSDMVRASTDLGELCAGLGLAGAIGGATSGLVFALLLAASTSLRAGTRRGVDELRLSAFGSWGALGAALGGFLLSRDVTFLAICATVGFGAAGSSLAIARRVAAPVEEPALLPPA
jgi:hypothetical protein